MEAFSHLRAANESKLLPTAECTDLRVCVCQKAPMGAMLQCELCRDAFHSACVRDLTDSRQAWPWLCPRCRRSEKPPLNQVLPLLASLQHTAVRLPEGEALHHLVERTLSWQQRMQEMSLSYNLPELEERAATPPTLTCWASGSHVSHNNTQVRLHLRAHCVETLRTLESRCLVLRSQAPCLTPEWTRTDHGQTVFYTEQRCIPLQGQCPFHRLTAMVKDRSITDG